MTPKPGSPHKPLPGQAVLPLDAPDGDPANLPDVDAAPRGHPLIDDPEDDPADEKWPSDDEDDLFDDPAEMPEDDPAEEHRPEDDPGYQDGG